MYGKRPLSLVYFGTVLLVLLLSLPQEGTAQTWGYPPGSEYNCMVQEFHWTIYPDEDSARAARDADCAGLPAGTYSAWGPIRGSCTQFIVFCKVPGGYYGSHGCRNPVFNDGKVYFFPYDCPGYPMPSQQADAPLTTEVTDANAGGGCAGRCDVVVGGGESR